MSSGNVYGTAWKREKSVDQLLLNGSRSLEEYSGVMQGIINGDVIEITPKELASKEGWFHITSNYGSVAEAIEDCACPSRCRFGHAAGRFGEIPMTVQPVDARVKPVPFDWGILRSPAVIGKYGPRLADPIKLFTFGARNPDFQRRGLVCTFWKGPTGALWYADLDVFGFDRSVSIFPGNPELKWADKENRDFFVLLCT